MTREKYESLPLATLKDLAKARKMKGISGMKKGDLIDAMLALDEKEKQKEASDEAKEEVNDEGKRVWFHGFHVLIDDELWNVDLWFFDTETITKAEAYCDGISSAVQKFPVYRERIFRIKDALREKGLYGFYQYSSMDVYRAVLEFGVQDSEELIAKFAKTKTD